MKKNSILYFLILSVVGLSIAPLHSFSEIIESGANKYKTISALSCDSLIKANAGNPDFVILDIRTPDVWKSDHLSGSINRNYYDSDIDDQLKALPKNKIFLLHCQSGGRSAPTLVKMKNLSFAEVYEMSGGINMWKSKALPTTSQLAPKLMLVSNGGTKNGTVNYGVADTLKIIITNRANDVLTFSSVILPSGNEFSSNFDLNKKLNGSDDYTFSVFYKPNSNPNEFFNIGLVSNGGTLNLPITIRKGATPTLQPIAYSEPEIYPNPAADRVSFKNFPEHTIQEVSLIKVNGQIVKRWLNFPSADQISVADLPEGAYFIRLVSDTGTTIKKLIVSR